LAPAASAADSTTGEIRGVVLDQTPPEHSVAVALRRRPAPSRPEAAR
jgi:hypothetical protein